MRFFISLVRRGGGMNFALTVFTIPVRGICLEPALNGNHRCSCSLVVRGET